MKILSTNGEAENLDGTTRQKADVAITGAKIAAPVKSAKKQGKSEVKRKNQPEHGDER